MSPIEDGLVLFILYLVREKPRTVAFDLPKTDATDIHIHPSTNITIFYLYKIFLHIIITSIINKVDIYVSKDIGKKL